MASRTPKLCAVNLSKCKGEEDDAFFCGLSLATGSHLPQLQSTSIRAFVKDVFAEVEVSKSYVNLASHPVEARFQFLQEGTVVFALTAQVEDQDPVVAVCKPKRNAVDDYEDAIAAGNTAFLMSKNKNTVDGFNINLGNLQPGDKCTVTFRYAEQLRVNEQGDAVFRIPAAGNGALFTAGDWSSSARYSESSPFVTLSVSFASSEPIASVLFDERWSKRKIKETSSIAMRDPFVSAEENEEGHGMQYVVGNTIVASRGEVLLSTSDSNSTPSTAFLMIFRPSRSCFSAKEVSSKCSTSLCSPGATAACSIWAERITASPKVGSAETKDTSILSKEEEADILRSLIAEDYDPCSKSKREKRMHDKEQNRECTAVALHCRLNLEEYASMGPRTELIFIVDRSGSMAGSRMRNCKIALQLFLRSLPSTVRFNIVSFGSDHELLFKDGSVEYTEDTFAQASKYISGMQADMGGTNLLPAFRSVLSVGPSEGYPRQIFCLTDGGIEKEAELFKLVRTSSYGARIFTFGIGGSSSRTLVKGLARIGGGTAEFVCEESDDLLCHKPIDEPETRSKCAVTNKREIASAVVRSLGAALVPSVAGVRVHWEVSAVNTATKIEETREKDENNKEEEEEGEAKTSTETAFANCVARDKSRKLKGKGHNKGTTATIPYRGMELRQSPSSTAPVVVYHRQSFTVYAFIPKKYLIIEEKAGVKGHTNVIRAHITGHVSCEGSPPIEFHCEELQVPGIPPAGPGETGAVCRAKKSCAGIPIGASAVQILAANAFIKELEDEMVKMSKEERKRRITRLGLQYSIATDHTSFVAEAQREEPSLESMLRAEQKAHFYLQSQVACENARGVERRMSIDNTLNELNEIFADLGTLIEEQAEMIDMIEANTCSSSQSVQSGVMELQWAEAYQRGSVFSALGSLASSAAQSVGSWWNRRGSSTASPDSLVFCEPDTQRPSATTIDPLEQLIMLQQFKGDWADKETVSYITGTKWNKMKAASPEIKEFAQDITEAATKTKNIEAVLLTLFVCWYITNKYTHRETEWRLLVDKAHKWTLKECQRLSLPIPPPSVFYSS